MNSNSLSFMLGYMEKKASFTDALSEGGKWAIDKALLAAAVAPALGGVATGALASKLSSPSDEKTVVQKALIAAELEEAVAELKRKRAIELAKAGASNVTAKERSLHL